jgi:hypothetical protein
MTKFASLFLLASTLAIGAAYGQPTSDPALVAVSQDPPPKPETKPCWEGTASCSVVCANGRCLTVNASCTGAATYEDAKRQLQASIEAQIKAEKGKLSGSISFTIKKQF